MNFRSRRAASRQPRACGVAAASALCLAAGIARAQPQIVFSDQNSATSKWRSALNDVNGKPIFDLVFAFWTRQALINPMNNAVRTYDATFMFQTCFGGGMIDDLHDLLTPRLDPGGPGIPRVTWVGGSASRWFESAAGRLLPPPPPGGPPGIPPINVGGPGAGIQVYDPVPYGFWTLPVIFQLLPNSLSITAINNGRVGDPIGSSRPLPQEIGQQFYANGGDNTPFVGPGHKYAVLWAGVADRHRHYWNLWGIRNQITTWWPAGTYTMVILYGNGAGANLIPGDPGFGNVPAGWQAATSANLQAALANIGNNITAGDHFFFYATGHGSPWTFVTGGEAPPAGGAWTSGILVDGGVYSEMLGDDFNQPFLEIDHTGLVGQPAPVFLNNIQVGSLSPTDSTSSFIIPESLILASNSLRVDNPNAADFTIDEARFSGGSFNEDPPGSRVCWANCDRSTIQPFLNVNDFQCFLNKFASGDPTANCDGSSIAPILNVNDFQCYLNYYAAGCSAP